MVIEWPFYRHLFPQQNKYEDIEITYLKLKEPTPQMPRSEVPARTYEAQLKFPQPTKMISSELSKAAEPIKAQSTPVKSEEGAPSETKRPEVKAEKKPQPVQKPSAEIAQPLVQKTEGITSIDLRGQSIVPASYAQAVRNKIKQNLNAVKSEIEGNVFVRFIIASDGELKELNIIDDKSTKNGFLRETVFEAIKKSSPFPNFPQDFVNPEVTFTCQILFQVK